jgi:transposase
MVDIMAEANYIDHEHKPQFQRSFSEEFKKRKIRELERNITSVPDICKTYYVSRTSVYKWIYKYSVMAKKQVKRQIKKPFISERFYFLVQNQFKTFVII